MPRTTPLLLLAAMIHLLAACQASPQATRSAATLAAPPAPAPTPATAEVEVGVAAVDFSGVWDSTYGALRLKRTAGGFAGRYTGIPGATLQGVLDGRVLRGEYHEPGGANGGVRGRFAFELSEDGQSFHGAWLAGAGAPLDPRASGAGSWTGRRAPADPDRIWFIILEENWEGSLREHEYSFGAMLRAFFERVPNVGVRHRFVHDRADLERYCAELAALAEPVVLYVSSHGSPDGLGIGPDGISPEALGAALRDVGDLRLLHLGACAMMAGDAPARIRAAAGAGHSFPISGFVETVGWAASALVDLTYMQLVLEQGMAPADAVAATRQMLTFANAPGDTGPLAGCDLTVSVAPEASARLP